MRKNAKLFYFIAVVLNFALIGGITYAAFVDKGSVLGSSFSVSNSDIKFLTNVAGSIEKSNLSEELSGPSFTNIKPYWQKDYLLKLYNNATGDLTITSSANYITANDTQDLRYAIFVEPIQWIDQNANGNVDEGESIYSYGKKSILKWKTEGFNLSTLKQGEVMGLILKFTTEDLSDTKQGATAIFDFEFNATPVTN